MDYAKKKNFFLFVCACVCDSMYASYNFGLYFSKHFILRAASLHFFAEHV